jgi:hypothetical protein
MIHASIAGSPADLRAAFETATPFPHVVVDRFFDEDVARAMLAEFPPPHPDRQRNAYGKAGEKSVYSDLSALGGVYREAHASFASPAFLHWLEEATGIAGLQYDPENYGGGTHENFDGRDLRPHVDFNYHPVTKLHRRLNVIVYLNEEWQASWGGSLALHRDPRDPLDEPIEILPIFNRCVIFETSERSWHGFAEVDLPDDRKHLSRKSLSIYLYTRERPDEETAGEHTTLFVPRPLPARFVAGLTLSDEDAHELGELMGHRDRLIQLYQGEQSRREPDSVRAAQLRMLVADLQSRRPLPIMGYVLASGGVEGMYPDGWSGALLRFRIDVARTATEVSLRGRIPEGMAEDATLTLAIDGEPVVDVRAVPGIVDVRGTIRLGPGAHDVTIATSATANHKALGRSGDERDLGLFLERLIFEHGDSRE